MSGFDDSDPEVGLGTPSVPCVGFAVSDRDVPNKTLFIRLYPYFM